MIPATEPPSGVLEAIVTETLNTQLNEDTPEDIATQAVRRTWDAAARFYGGSGDLVPPAMAMPARLSTQIRPGHNMTPVVLSQPNGYGTWECQNCHDMAFIDHGVIDGDAITRDCGPGRHHAAVA